MVELSKEERHVLSKPLQEVDWHDIEPLKAARTKLGISPESEEYFQAILRVAVAVEKTTRPHFEKARLYQDVARIAMRQGKDCSKFFDVSADYNARDGSLAKAAELYEMAADHGIAEKLDTTHIRSCLRNSRRMYDLLGESSDAGRIHIREKDLILANANLPYRVLLTLVRGVSAYGESPARVAVSAAFVIAICASIFWFTGLTSNATDELLHSVWTSLYFSVVTFTTLGYGDFSPPPGLARVAATIEALCGLFLMSLFLVTLVRRFGR